MIFNITHIHIEVVLALYNVSLCIYIYTYVHIEVVLTLYNQFHYVYIHTCVYYYYTNLN